VRPPLGAPTGGRLVSTTTILLTLLWWPQAAYASPATGQWGGGVDNTAQQEEPVSIEPVAEAEAASKASVTVPKVRPKPKNKKKKNKNKKRKKKKARSASTKDSKDPVAGNESAVEAESAAFESAELDGERALDRRRVAKQAANAKIEAGQGLEAAAELMAAAESEGDPALMVSAAEAAAAVFGTKQPNEPKQPTHPGDRSAAEAAKSHGALALARISELEGTDDEFALLRLGLDRADLEGLRSRAVAASARGSEVASAPAKAAPTGPSKSLRIARGEIISGAVLIGLGVSGFALMGSGLRLNALADRELQSGGIANLADLPPDLRAPFEQQYEQAATLTAVGAVLGVAGSALGGTLIAAGLRDRKRAGQGAGSKSKRATIQGAPSLSQGAAGFVIGGRF